VLLALQAHSDDIPLMASGTVAKLIEEGYTGYLVRATNDDMGDAPGLGTPGTIGESVLRNEHDTDEIARVLGCRRTFNLNYNNHRMADVSLNELICRLILIIRFVKADTVVCWDPWAHDEENPDHYMLARGLEAACWMAGRAHDYPEQLAAGLQTHEVADKYYFARRPEITRVVDISRQIDKKIDANRANTGKGPAGHLGSRLRAELAKKGRCSAMAMTSLPTETTSENSVCGKAANLDKNTASNTRRPSTTCHPGARAPEPIPWSTATSSSMQCR
jgi:LmbE family N-acetylglucosaminyl deacetylase